MISLVDLLFYPPGVTPPPTGGPQTFTGAPALVGAVAYGAIPFRFDSELAPPPITAHICREDDLSTPVRLLDQSRSRQWLEPYNDAGSGSLELLNTDPDLADLQELDVIQFKLYGWAAFTMLARTVRQVLLDPQDRAAQVTSVSGQGHLQRFDMASVDPSNGLDAYPVQEDRQFNWRAFEYDDVAWGNAIALCSVADAKATEWPTRPMGDGFPDLADADMIWAPGTSSAVAPEGHCYFRHTFTAATTGKVVAYALIDNLGEIYIDGVPIFEVSIGDGYVNVSTAVIEVSAGTHQIAIHAQNVTAGSPGGIAFALYDADASGAPVPETAPILVSDDSWKIVAYPPGPPGMSIGAIILLALGEWMTAGYIPTITCAFTAELDSGGNPWPVTADVATKVGTDGFTFLVRELGETYVDLWMEPGAWTLHAWNKGDRGADTAVSIHAPTDLADPRSANLLGLTNEENRAPINRLLIKWPGGWHEVKDEADIAARGGKVLSGTLGLGAAPSIGEVERIARGQLNVLGRSQEAIETTHRDDGPANRPYWAYSVRDRVLVDRDTVGTQELQVVQEIGVTEDAYGNVTYAPTLKDLLREQGDRLERAITKMSNGTLQGRSDVATPVANIATPGGPSCCPPQPTAGDPPDG